MPQDQLITGHCVLIASMTAYMWHIEFWSDLEDWQQWSGRMLMDECKIDQNVMQDHGNIICKLLWYIGGLCSRVIVWCFTWGRYTVPHPMRPRYQDVSSPSASQVSAHLCACVFVHVHECVRVRKMFTIPENVFFIPISGQTLRKA